MMRTIVLALCLAAALPAAAQESLSATDPLGAATLFADEAECLKAAQESKADAAGLFRAGRYLMAQAYLVQSKSGNEHRKAFELCKNAYGFFETAFRLKPEVALYAAWSGSARLLSCAYGSTFDTIQNGAKGVASFKTAIKLEPEDPDLRLLRARAYVYLPRAYYPDCDELILEDSGKIISSSAQARAEQGSVLEEALCYRCIAFKQSDKADEAAAALAQIDPNSRFAKLAGDWRKR